MAQVRSARVGRTALLTAGAVFLTTAVASDWVPLPGADQRVLQMLAVVPVLLVMVGLPFYNIREAVLDARVLESTGRWSVMLVFRWLITLAAVIINFFLIAVTFFFAAMLINGPAVA
jgi:hypothetical protein